MFHRCSFEPDVSGDPDRAGMLGRQIGGSGAKRFLSLGQAVKRGTSGENCRPWSLQRRIPLDEKRRDRWRRRIAGPELLSANWQSMFDIRQGLPEPFRGNYDG